MSPLEIEAIERATLAAVPPASFEELPGWLVPLDPGTVGRSHSAVPLSHDAPDLAGVDAVERCFARAKLPAVWRLPMLAQFDGLSGDLTRRGYQPTQPTCVQIGCVNEMLRDAALPTGAVLSLSAKPTPAWTSVYLGPGFDPMDGACRVALLGRGEHTTYAAVELNGQALASGAMSASNGWASIHGMRTAPEARGQGLAGAVLAALAGHAHGRGLKRVFLQVEQGNAVAQRLYAARGFKTAWVYQYWRLD